MSYYLSTDDQFDDFTIVDKLGAGGMASVYQARHAQNKRLYAIKILHEHFATDEEVLDRFKREAHIVSQLKHPAIVPIYKYGTYEGVPFLVMRFMQNGSLADLFDQPKPVSIKATMQLLRKIAGGMDFAHSQGVVHRDLKLENILLDEKRNPALSDFGIARTLESTRLTATGQLIGTPLYMSPEQITGAIVPDHRADLYAFAIIAYLMLTGYFPFTNQELGALLFQHMNQPPPRPSQVNQKLPEALDPVMMQGMAKNPDDRYQTAQEFVLAVRQAFARHKQALNHQTMVSINKTNPIVPFSVVVHPTQAATKQPSEPEPKPRSNRTALSIVAVVGLLLIAGVVLGQQFFGGTNVPEDGVQVAAAAGDDDPTLTVTVTPSATDAPTDTPTSTPTDAPTASETPLDVAAVVTEDSAAMGAAARDDTQATDTPSPTATATEPPTATDVPTLSVGAAPGSNDNTGGGGSPPSGGGSLPNFGATNAVLTVTAQARQTQTAAPQQTSAALTATARAIQTQAAALTLTARARQTQTAVAQQTSTAATVYAQGTQARQTQNAQSTQAAQTVQAQRTAISLTVTQAVRQTQTQVSINLTANYVPPTNTPRPTNTAIPTNTATPTINYQPVAWITRFVLVDADTNSDVAVIQNGMSFSSMSAPHRWSVRADVGGSVESVTLYLGDHQQRQNIPPYALFDDGGGNYNGRLYQPGTYTVRAVPYTEDQERGQAGQAAEVTFTFE